MFERQKKRMLGWNVPVQRGGWAGGGLILAGIVFNGVLFSGCGPHTAGSQNPTVPAGPAWVSDPRLAGQLGPEEQIDGYGIRPPAGYTEKHIEVRAQDGSGVRYIWTGPADAAGMAPYLQLDLGTDTGLSSPGISSDTAVQLGMQAATQTHNQMIYSSLEQGVINGQSYSRIYWKGSGLKTGRRFHGLVYGRIAAPAIVTIRGRDAEPGSGQTLPLLEASALTVRKL